jgi:hypothetical protein
MNGSVVIPSVQYNDAPAAIAWLEQALGFERHAVYDGPHGTLLLAAQHAVNFGSCSARSRSKGSGARFDIERRTWVADPNASFAVRF